MLTVKQFVRMFAKTDGTEILEAALVLPLLFMVLLGIVEFGRAFNIYSTIQHAAQQGAITAARATCATCSPTGNTFPDIGTVNNTIAAVLQASNLDSSQIVHPPSKTPTCGGQPCTPCLPPLAGRCTLATGGGVYVCQNMQLNPSGNTQPSQCGTVVSFQYPFTFNLPFTSLNLSTINLSAQAESRMEN